MNKSLKTAIMLLASVFMVCIMIQAEPETVQAKGLGYTVYDFSGISIPAGQTQQFAVDATMLTAMLSRNADGTYAVDATGSFIGDDAKIAYFVAMLAARYDTPGVAVIDQDTEKAYIKKLISSGAVDSAHKPVFKPAGTGAAIQAVTAAIPGATYIDVNLTDQRLCYFVNGQAFLISDIVTGNVSLGHDTPVGTYAVYAKQTDRTLKGNDYEAFVKYWMPFYKSYGIHDASWRGRFGGTIYKNSGSHGCVNMPGSNAEQLFNTVNVGTPVLVHY